MPQVAIKTNLDLSDAQWESLRASLFAGRRIEAIKMVRKFVPRTGLVEAKSYVETIETELRSKEPEKFNSAVRDGSPMLIRRLLLFCFFLAAVVLVIVVMLHR